MLALLATAWVRRIGACATTGVPWISFGGKLGESAGVVPNARPSRLTCRVFRYELLQPALALVTELKVSTWYS